MENYEIMRDEFRNRLLVRKRQDKVTSDTLMEISKDDVTSTKRNILDKAYRKERLLFMVEPELETHKSWLYC